MKKDNQSINKKVKITKGVVVSDKMTKTVVVKVDRYLKHPKYGKYYTVSKKYKAHDENNEYKVGDVVEIQESKPISKDKSHIVMKKVGEKIIK
ncbi:MAG: 30S ribosomal protein S17 [Cyanobium sp. MAG06]|nr:30S ribosomal protein S17 [Cyanobium sp. MAG06]